MGGALVLGLAEIATHLIDYGAYHLRIGALDAGQRFSVFGVVSLAALALAVLASLPAAIQRDTASGERRLLTVLLAVLFALRLAQPPHVLAISLLPALMAVVVLWRLAGPNESGCFPVRLGCALLVLSFGVHAFGTKIVSILGYGTDSWTYEAKVAIKHASELAGWLAVGIGVFTLQRRPRFSKAPRRQT